MTTPDDDPHRRPYGEPAPPPYFTPPGQPAPPPYGQPAAPPPYGQPAPPPPYGYGPGYGGAYGQPSGPRDYAPWLLRATGFLLDSLLGALAAVPMLIGLALTSDDSGGSSDTGGAGAVLYLLGLLLFLGFQIWNVWRQGTTGASYGKQAVGIEVLRERTGAPTGGWLSIGRQLAHFVDSVACYVGWLWPLWDAKRQTFADKIVGTVVVRRSR